MDGAGLSAPMNGGPEGRRKVNVMKLDCSRYDPDLEMFTQPSREPDLNRLRFLRWLGEQGRLEHAPVGAPGGDYALRPVVSRPDLGHPTAI
jgi:hypothetical protein